MIVMPTLDIRDKLRFGMSLIVSASYHALCASHPYKGAVDVVCRSNGDSQ
jgi:hypothetical protein